MKIKDLIQQGITAAVFFSICINRKEVRKNMQTISFANSLNLWVGIHECGNSEEHVDNVI